MKLYGDLASWFHLLTHPSEYADEAALAIRAIEVAAAGHVETLLELGSGGGNNASYLKHRFACTLADISEEMLKLSSSLNPECEHIAGDMRTLRLERAFDAVFIHDAIEYMTSEGDLRAAIETASVHTRPSGAVLIMPDCVRETLAPSTDHGGHDGDDGRSLRYLEWVTDPDPADTTYDVDFVVALREPGEPLRVEHDRHVFGVFPRDTWRRLFDETGLELLELELDDPFAGEHEIFAARKR